jgi:hypothetical protein
VQQQAHAEYPHPVVHVETKAEALWWRLVRTPRAANDLLGMDAAQYFLYFQLSLPYYGALTKHSNKFADVR